jgi:thymidylate synthase
MHTITCRNVNEALPVGYDFLIHNGRREDSRDGVVLVSPVPVMTVYERPTERVLFSSVRDANPFFHLTEAIWMLCGRADARLLTNFVRTFDRFAEDDGLIHGAYGRRWRRHFILGEHISPHDGEAHPTYADQLSMIVSLLRDNPNSRQVVLTMWDPEVDLGVAVKDRPCNTHVYFRVRRENETRGGEPTYDDYLDMTVCCRSNDIIMGAYGANAVHLSILQEFVAASVGVYVGRYYQFSNNYHMYQRDVDMMGERAANTERHTNGDTGHMMFWDQQSGLYRNSEVRPDLLVDDPDSFLREAAYVLNAYETLGEGPPDAKIEEAVSTVNNKFLYKTLWRMLKAHLWHRAGNRDRAEMYANNIVSWDWGLAVRDWLDRRWRAKS